MTRVRRSSLLIWLLAATLVVAQGLALMHRVVHGAHLDASHAASLAVQDDARWTQDLFSGHDDTSCKLLDAAAHHALPCADAAVGILPPATLLALSAGEALARQAVLAQARGPPAFIR